MRKYFLFAILAVLVFSCKDEEEDPMPIDNPNIIGVWQRVSKGIVYGSDTTYTDYSESIYHYYYQDGSYKETKSGSGILNSEAHYEYSLVNDTLKFYSMGSLSHSCRIKLYLKTMIIDMGTESGYNVTYKLSKN